jgi:hypothetical protein
MKGKERRNMETLQVVVKGKSGFWEIGTVFLSDLTVLLAKGLVLEDSLTRHWEKEALMSMAAFANVRDGNRSSCC